MAGYIKLYRGSRDTDGLMPSKHFSDWEAWVWLIENAAWKPTTRFNAKGEEIAIGRGEMHVSYASLASAFGWTIKRVRGFLVRLEAVKKVALQRAQSGTLLTICNYELFQGQDVDVGHTEGHSQGTVRAQSGHTQEEGKEGKKERKKKIYTKKDDVSEWQKRLSPELWADFKKHRAAKRAPITATSLKGIEREAAKAGISFERAVKVLVERGWTGFKAEWHTGEKKRSLKQTY